MIIIGEGGISFSFFWRDKVRRMMTRVRYSFFGIFCEYLSKFRIKEGENKME